MTAPEPLDMAGPADDWAEDAEDGRLVAWLLLAALLTVVVVVALVWLR